MSVLNSQTYRFASLNFTRDSDTYENQSAESPKRQSRRDIPTITIDDPDRNRITRSASSSSSSTETEMSSSHRSHTSSTSSSKSKHSSSSRSKPKTDDWSEITDPEERRRVQNRIAQRKFRDKAKETKERQDRDAENRHHAGHSYHTPDPRDMGGEQELSGLPWGSLSLRHVVSKGKTKEADSRRDSEDRSHYDSREHTYESKDAYYEGDSTYYEDRAYYDYGSGGSGHGGHSR